MTGAVLVILAGNILSALAGYWYAKGYATVAENLRTDRAKEDSIAKASRVMAEWTDGE